MTRLIFSFIVVLFTQTILQAQRPNLASTDKKALSFYKDAETFYTRMEYTRAEEMALKAIKKDRNFVDAHALIAYVKIAQNDLPFAITKFEEAIQINPLHFDGFYLDLGILYFKNQQYQAALKPLKIFLNERKPKSASLRAKAQKYIASAEFAMEAVKNPVPFEPENLGPGINTELKEYLPVISVDQQKIVFTRNIPDPNNAKGLQEDFYVSYQTPDGWSKAMNMGKPLNTHVNEGGHTLSADGKTMVFTICEIYGDYGPGRKGLGSCDLFVSHKKGNGWSEPRNLGPQINTSFFDSQPSLSANGKELYFSSTRGGGYGQTDIFVVGIGPEGASKPKNLGPVINTSGREEGVFIHPDGKTLYFSSDGHPGMGASDIFMSRRNDDGTWGKPVNLGYPINTHKDEIDFVVDALGNYAYFTSDRPGGYGDWDIYRFKLPESIQPIPVTYLRGLVWDSETKKKLQAKFELIDIETKEVRAAADSKEDGSFLVVLPNGRDYALNVSKDGYLFHSESFTLKSENQYKPFEKNVALQALKAGNSVVLKNVFFDTDSYVLKPSSEAELDKLYDFMQKNAGITIELSGHTDNQGKPAYNLTLSKQRASAVREYLIQKGINGDRMTSEGYGETQPIDSNDTPEGRANNRRTEFKITKF